MKEFVYRVLDNGGAVIHGKVSAATYRDARSRLVHQFPQILSIKEEASKGFGLRSRKIKARELAIFTRQLSLMLGAGLSLRMALKAVARQPISGTLKSEIEGIIEDVESGASFSESLLRRPKSFSGFFVAMVRTGETAGILHETLRRLTMNMEKEIALRQKVRTATVYPIMMVCVALVVLFIMAAFVLPKFEALFLETNATLPLFTQVILDGSRFVGTYWPFILIALGAGGYSALRFLRQGDLFEGIQKYAWKIPMADRLFEPFQIARFCRGLALLDAGGVPIITSIKVSAESLGSPRLKKGTEEATERLEKGASLSEAFEGTGVFPEFLIQMLSVGEATGELARVMSDLADYYDEEVSLLLERFSALLEPLMILGLSVIIGMIVVALLLPIFSLGETAYR